MRNNEVTQARKPDGARLEAVPVDDEALAAAQAIIGIEHRRGDAVIEVTPDIVRDYCVFMGSQNPLFLDLGYARLTRWGGITAPPTMLGSAIIHPRLPGIQPVYVGTEWDFQQAVHVGEIIVQRAKYTGAEKRMGGNVPQSVLQTAEVTCTNQRNEVVTNSKTYIMRVPRSKTPGGLSYKPRYPRYSAKQIAAIDKEIESEKIRGSKPRFWEDTAIGEQLGPVIYGPYTVTEICFTGLYLDMGRHVGMGTNPGAHVFRFANFKRDPKTGLPFAEGGGHWQLSMAEEIGMPGRYDYGPQRLSWLCRLVTDWMGDDAFLKKLAGRLKRPNIVGDTTLVRGEVERKWVEDKEHLVKCRLWAENQVGEITMTGSGIVRLLARCP